VEKLKKTSKVLSVVFKLVLLIVVVQFILCLVDLGTNRIAPLLKNQGAEFIKLSNFDIGNCEWHFLREQEMETKYFVQGIIIEFLAVALEFIVNVFLFCTFGKLLKPMTQGQPYDGTISRTMRKLGLACILIGIVGNVLSYLQVAREYQTLREIRRIFLTVTVTGIDVSFSINLGHIFIGIMILVFSLVFRYGEELQVQVDETL
jgi:hypothetical protein